MEPEVQTPAAGTDPMALLLQLVDQLRPLNPEDGESANSRIQALTFALERDPALRRQVQDAITTLFATRRAGSLYVAVGILPITGFFSEAWRRISHTLLPDVRDPDTYLEDLLAFLLPRKTDKIWVEAVEEQHWLALLQSLHMDEGSDPKTLPCGLPGLLNGLWLLSYRMTVLGFDGEILRLDPTLARTESPFLAQNLETRSFVECCLQRWDDPEAVAEDEKQLLVLFDQCRQAVERIHRRAAQGGTSLQLTYKLQCLRDHIRRGEHLAIIAGELQRDRSGRTAYPSIVALLKGLVAASCSRNDLRSFWQQNMEILSRRVTEYAGKAGEHYITESRQEYLGMARAAMGAGIIIACMAMNKLLLHHQGLAPLNEMVSYGLNYGLGFMVIYMLGLTVATKQPAMTANALAASIGEARGKVRDLENLITLVARTTRSQLVAILGNVMLAIPVAILISLLAQILTSQPLISAEEAGKLLASHHPLKSGSLIYAGIAGVCLFLSGLIAGYFDNMTTYNRIPQRLKQLEWPRRFFGQHRLNRFADYVERNMGALSGNFLFGMMLGSAWGIGMLLGLPIDIRHVAFSSAYLGFAAAAYDFAPPVADFVWACVGVAGIGLVNLAVSFSLALFVALRSRGVTFSQGRQLMRGILRRFLSHPGEFFLPPRKPRPDLVQ